jgi:hypothetical protein
MKNPDIPAINKPGTRTLSYIASAIGIAIVSFGIGYFYAYQPEGEEISTSKISVEKANAYFNAYYKQARPEDSILKGILVSRDEYKTMQLLFENETTAGVRIYFGINGNQDVRMMTGYSAENRDILEPIFLLDGSVSDLCPTICDIQSPITVNVE